MKNLVIRFSFLLFALTICSFQTPNPTVQEIFQEALNIEELAKHLVKNDHGEILPVVMATNGLLSERMNLSLAGKTVSMVTTNIDIESETSSVLDLKEIKRKVDPVSFFRINRSQLINISFIEKIEPYFKNRLSIKMTVAKDTLLTSGAKTVEFRKWIES